jgi:hypothetical protein
VSYGVYLAFCHLSNHDTFDGALDEYRKVCLRFGAHVRSPNGDDEHDGFTEDQRAALDAAHSEALKTRRTK